MYNNIKKPKIHLNILTKSWIIIKRLLFKYVVEVCVCDRGNHVLFITENTIVVHLFGYDLNVGTGAVVVISTYDH